MRRLICAGLSLLLVAAVLSVAYAVVRVSERGRFATAYSSYGAGPEGTLALFRLTEELGFSARAFTRELSHLPRGSLVLIEGCRGKFLRPVTRPEREALTHWVERGGLLILAGAYDAVPRGAGLSLSRQARCRESEKTPLSRLFGERNADPVESSLPERMTAFAAGPPLTHLLPFDVHEASTLREALDAEATELLASDEGSLALTTPLGRGRVVLLGIPDALTNQALSDGGGLLYARILRAFAPEGPVLFDEYHLGMGERRSLIGYLRDVGFSGPLLELALAALALLLAGSARIGKVRASSPRARQTRSFVEALANLFQRSQDTEGALERLSNDALARIARAYRSPLRSADELCAFFDNRGLAAVSTYVRRVREHGASPLAPGESVTQRAQAIERDETAALVVGQWIGAQGKSSTT